MIGICCVVGSDISMRDVWESKLNDLGFIVIWHRTMREARVNYSKIYPDVYLIDIDCVNLKGVSFFYELKKEYNRKLISNSREPFIRDSSVMIYGVSENHNRDIFSFVDQFVFCPSEIAPIQYHYQSKRNNLRHLLIDW